jgi:hypothetical protein
MRRNHERHTETRPPYDLRVDIPPLTVPELSESKGIYSVLIDFVFCTVATVYLLKMLTVFTVFPWTRCVVQHCIYCFSVDTMCSTTLSAVEVQTVVTRRDLVFIFFFFQN